MADLLLNEAGVAPLAGTAFGAYGEGYLRLSYANSLENIEKALARIKGRWRRTRISGGRYGRARERAAHGGDQSGDQSKRQCSKASKTGKTASAKRGDGKTRAVATSGE